MSKLYSLYETLKKENQKTIYLFKSGIFYIALSNDAIYLSNKFNFKLTNFNNSIVKCGFPISSSEKYIKIFKNNNINFKIIDSSVNTIYSPKEFELNNNILNLIDSISSTDPDKLSVYEAYEFISFLKEKCLELKKLYNI
ncbi:MAG: hypothetical protein HFJ60_05020 [Clostridia bacterium]|nr:hypothetical protein [Clostridia bacterium]